MRRIRRTFASVLLCVAAAAAAEIPVVVSARARPAERTAAAELAAGLGRTYPRDSFTVRTAAPAKGTAILVGTPASMPELKSDQLREPESYVVTSTGRGLVVAGADERGVLYGVFALLEKLGWGFYLSYDAAQPPRTEPFSPAGWNLADAPLFRDRVIFNWHNFLSSASTWELDDWQRWIRGAAHMRYNTVMIHAYGNNPMFTFRFNGQTKPVGYLATTQKGRDWGTQHVNDVRRLPGGQLFRSPVFGSSAALVPEDERVPAAQALVSKAFAYARTYGLHVTFALDVDTESANPRNVILTLPESARFRAGRYQLADPETPQGYAYWKAQVEQLLGRYPEIDRLIVWFRANDTPWRGIKAEEFPAAWKARYQSALDRNPAMRNDKDAPSMFAIGRIAAAFSRALGELGRRDVELGTGTWHFNHLPAAAAMMDPGLKLYWLDYSIVFDKPATQALLRSIPRDRPMLPIVWAHHDDRTFVGPPYPPFKNFASLVDGTGTGFGIIHWTTRPLDLYFKSLGEQVWRDTRDRPLAATTRDMAARSFGAPAAGIGGEYLAKWVSEGRMFGRDTGNRFIDVPLADAPEVISRTRERLRVLESIDQKALTAEGRERLQYHRDYEVFAIRLFEAHAAFERAQDLHKRGQLEEARETLRGVDPAAVVAQYVKASSHGSISRGEQALVIALDLKWLPFIVSLRQALGLEPVRVKFQPTRHEPLAQGAGTNTFWLDRDRTLWRALGQKETGLPEVAQAEQHNELCASGVRIDKPARFQLSSILGDKLAAGRYRLEMVFAAGAKPRVEARDGALSSAVSELGQAIEVRSGTLEVTVIPAQTPVVACGMVLKPDGQ